MTETIDSPDVGPSDGDSDTPRRRPIAPWIVAGIAVVMIGLVAVLISATSDGENVAESPLIGRPAPEATGELADGTPFDLSRRKGSWVVLNFFTADCIPCIQEHPDLIRFHEEQQGLGADGAELYSVVVNDTPDDVEAFFDERGGEWPVVYSEFDNFPVAFGVAQVPETWIIDPNGVVQLRLISKVTAEQMNVTMQQFREQWVG